MSRSEKRILFFLGLALALGFALTGQGAMSQFQAGDFQLTLDVTTNGARLASLFDRGRQRELLGTNAAPLFTVVLRRAGGPEFERLEAQSGWADTVLRRTRQGFEIRWERPQKAAWEGFAVVATAEAEAKAAAWRWQLRVEDRNPTWSVSRVIFPELALRSPGERAAVFFPRGPGEVQAGVWERRFSFHGTYPSGWCSMQFMGVLAEGEPPGGLYCAVHDPWGSTKDLGLDADPETHTVRLRFDHPAPNMGVSSNGFVLSGEAVWQLLRGDWFDAAQIYKTWVRQEARWWPALKSGQRADTPPWMRELDAWAMTGGAPAECVSNVIRFREFLGEPVGFHWYNWHQIPFDNDYPHYFPAKAGFEEAVGALKQAGVYVMPYINGRLWDTHDRGSQDFEFNRLALPAATKREDGQPWVESYGSKETNGEPVKLAVMCPTTALWQQTVRETVLRLLEQAGASAVYVDQIAAAAPALCLDPSHGHPLGGGHWWNQGYWHLLEAIRRAKPGAAALTTECNGEPFVRWFDGYLTWHWQFDGQVPAFPAIYGGAIQMFGRAYRGGDTKDLALRMKAGQQLVFGEQLGWLDPGLVNEPENADFFRQMVRVRARFHRYFYAGEMARPPRLEGLIPKVKADWQWSGQWPVTTDAVLTGAWRLAGQRRMVLFFVNVSDEAVSARLRLDGGNYGIRGKWLNVQVTRAGEQDAQGQRLPAAFEQPVTFARRQAQVWELEW
ncbi:MAG: DUF6259 domain-containing protein [Verrucomicrobiota bacterium]|jgi:hypothetical protein